MAHIKLVALDLDGTLLNKDGEISAYNKTAVSRLLEDNIKVVLATGRAQHSAHRFLEELNLDSELISFNGAMITNRNSNILYEEYLDELTIKQLLVVANKYNVFHQAFCGNRWHVSSVSNSWLNYYISVAKISNYIYGFDNLDGYLFHKFMFVGENNVLQRIYLELTDLFFDNIYVVFTKPNYLEVMNKNVSKANAIKFLLNRYKIDVENTMAFGDEENDISMLNFVNISVAMNSASSKVKDNAQYTTDVVGAFINKYFDY